MARPLFPSGRQFAAPTSAATWVRTDEEYLSDWQDYSYDEPAADDSSDDACSGCDISECSLCLCGDVVAQELSDQDMLTEAPDSPIAGPLC
jgi:hypothetical protein